MPRRSAPEHLGPASTVHLVEVELDQHTLGGRSPTDPYDRDRGREAANLFRRFCKKQEMLADYAVVAVRIGSVRVRCGFADVIDRDRLIDVARAEPVDPGPWASRARIWLDPDTEEVLEEASIPRDTRGPGRRAYERRLKEEEDRGLLWIVRGQ